MSTLRTTLRRTTPVLALLLATAVALVPHPRPAHAQALCPDVPHDPEPIELDCASVTERWAVVDPSTGAVTNIVGWTGTNKWRPPVGQVAMDLPEGASAGPGWWYVDGEFVRDSFDRNLTARADILSVHLSWSTGGLGVDTDGVRFTVTVQPTGQQKTTSGSSLTFDPLEAGVTHSFTVTATLPDGSTRQGPTVNATPEKDPDPDCTDRSVARECRAATNWAVVHPSSGMVDNVIVCTAAQCGVDGEWGGKMPSDTPWPGHHLIELSGTGGIGWQYVDGRFVDVRPTEVEEAPESPETPEAGATTEETVVNNEETVANNEAEEDTSASASVADETTDADPTPSTSASNEDDVLADIAGAAPAMRSPTGVESEDERAAADDENEDGALTEAAPEPNDTLIRRITGTIAAFFRGLFSR